MIPKTIHFLKSTDGTGNGTKKVQRYKSIAVLPSFWAGFGLKIDKMSDLIRA